MKKLILLPLILLSLSFAFGQNREIIGGGGGHFMTGVTFIIPNSLTDYLKEPNVVGSAYDHTPVAIQAGGEGYGKRLQPIAEGKKIEKTWAPSSISTYLPMTSSGQSISTKKCSAGNSSNFPVGHRHTT